MSSFCPTCGTQIEPPARFCRRCGTQVGPGGPSIGPSEATTWTLEQSSSASPGTQSVVSPATAPAYLSPQPYPVAPLDTNKLSPKKHTVGIILAVLLLLMVAAGAGLLTYNFALKTSNSTETAAPQPAEPPKDTGDSGIPPLKSPPIPPVAPAPPSEGKSSTSTTGGPMLKDLRYPGSKSTFNIGGAGEGVMMLSSKDPVKKVAAWYSARIQVTNRTEAMGATVLTGKSFTVTITGSDGETQIIVANGAND